MSDNNNTVHRLPRLPSQIKLLVYEKVDQEGNAHVLHARRKVVQEYLTFFMKHNPLYKGVMRNGQQVVPPVEEVPENWDHVPEDGPLEGVPMETVANDGEKGGDGDAACVEDLNSQGVAADDDEGLPSDAEPQLHTWRAR